MQLGRVGVNLIDFALGLHVFGAGLDGLLENVLFVPGVLGEGDVALAVEIPGDGAALGHAAAVFGDDVADLGDGSVLVIGERVANQGDAPGAVGLVARFLVTDAAVLAGAFLDGLLDLVLGHVCGSAGDEHGAQAWVHVGVAPAQLRGDGNFLGEFGKDFAALLVDGGLLAFDRAPFGVTGHPSPPLNRIARKPGRKVHAFSD